LSTAAIADDETKPGKDQSLQHQQNQASDPAQGNQAQSGQDSPTGQSDSQSTESMHREGDAAQAQQDDTSPTGQSDSQSTESMHREGDAAQSQSGQDASQDGSVAQGQQADQDMTQSQNQDGNAAQGSPDAGQVQGGTSPTYDENQAQGDPAAGQDNEPRAEGKEGSPGTQSGPEPQAGAGEQSQSDQQSGQDESFAQGQEGSQDAQAGQTQQDQSGQQTETDGAAQNDPNMNPNTGNVAEEEDADSGRVGRRPDQPGGAVSAEDQELLSELKKCESLSGDMKTQCVDDAKKKAGKM
jgi:hypothetical protein